MVGWGVGREELFECERVMVVIVFYIWGCVLFD